MRNDYLGMETIAARKGASLPEILSQWLTPLLRPSFTPSPLHVVSSRRIWPVRCELIHGRKVGRLDPRVCASQCHQLSFPCKQRHRFTHNGIHFTKHTHQCIVPLRSLQAYFSPSSHSFPLAVCTLPLQHLSPCLRPTIRNLCSDSLSRTHRGSILRQTCSLPVLIQPSSLLLPSVWRERA